MPPVVVSQKDADRMVQYETDVKSVFLNGTTGGTPALPVQFAAPVYNAAFEAFMRASFISISRMMLSFQAFNNQVGPMPLTSGSFTTRGQTLLVLASGSGFHASPGQLIGMNIQVDGVTKGVSRVYTNEASSHKAFVMNPLLVTGIAAGAHTLSLTALGTTSTDANDIFNATVIELPF